MHFWQGVKYDSSVRSSIALAGEFIGISPGEEVGMAYNSTEFTVLWGSQQCKIKDV